MGHQERLSVRAHTTSTHTLVVHTHTCTHARTRTHTYGPPGRRVCLCGQGCVVHKFGLTFLELREFPTVVIN
jgi:hypothetical protein